MTHFTVVVAAHSPSDIEDLLAPYSEHLEVDLRRDYLSGPPAGFWAVESLRKKAGLNLDDATLTWSEVAEAYNSEYSEEGAMKIDADGRAYEMTTSNPQGYWDYWRIGGRWGGYFPFRPGEQDNVIMPQADWDSPDEVRPDYCDGGPLRSLDIARMRKIAETKAIDRYRNFHQLVKGTPEPLPWASFIKKVTPGINVTPEGYTIDEARRDYANQERINLLLGSVFDQPFSEDIAVEFNGKTEGQYASLAAATAVPGFATVTAEGEWLSGGTMGWFGSHTGDEDDKVRYLERANAYIDSLPESMYLIVTDCHV